MKRRRVIYEPPPRPLIEQFARDACRLLAQEDDPSFEDPEVVAGFADCLWFVAHVIARNLNEGGGDFVDKPKS